MALFFQENLLFLFSATLVMLLALATFNIRLYAKIRKLTKESAIFFSGKNGKDLQEVMNKQASEIKNLDKEVQELFEASNKIYNLAFRSLHKVGVVRFNPFKDLGGNQSFAISLLDGKDSGVVFSSLHTKEGTRIYAKPILKGTSLKYSLTKEEEQAIKISRINKQDNKIIINGKSE